MQQLDTGPGPEISGLYELELKMVQKSRQLISSIAPTAFMVAVWAFLFMFVTERFVLPFVGMGRWLTPWRQLFKEAQGNTLGERMVYMEVLLDRSVMVGNLGLLVMLISFISLVVYSTTVIQQKQRRARENEILLIKNREIERRNEFIRYISATIGHEFKNNLGRIKRRLALMELPATELKHIEVNMEKLFADINIFKKISDEREAGLIKFEGVELVSMVESLAAQNSDLLDINIMSELDAPIIFAARPLLLTVFENIFDNAVKYKKPEDKRASVSIAFSLDMDGVRRYVSVSIKDKGIGMDEVMADTCFYKGMGSGEGWGEGLYFTKYVVGLHAGKIKVGKEYTAPGVGAELIISLPYVEEALDV